MKMSAQLQTLLAEVKTVHAPNAKPRVNASSLKEMAVLLGFHSTIATASLGILAKLADSIPMDFEDRSAIDSILDLALADVESSDFVASTQLINEAVKILHSYRK